MPLPGCVAESIQHVNPDMMVSDAGVSKRLWEVAVEVVEGLLMIVLLMLWV